MVIFWLVVGGGALVIGAIVFARRVSRSAGKRLRLEGGSVYYAGLVTAQEAEHAGRYLGERGIFKAGLKDARLFRDASTYQLQLICSSGLPDETQNLAAEVLAAGFADDVVAGAPVEVQICDAILRPIAVIPHHGRFGRRLGMNAASLFYLDGVTFDEALNVATFLAAVGLFNESPKIAQLNRAGDGFEFRVAVNVDPLTTEMIDGQVQMAKDLSRQVMGGKPVDVQYCHGLAATLRTEPAHVRPDEHDPMTIPRGQSLHSRVFHVPQERGERDDPGDSSAKCKM
jgi:hypothetical protein